MLQDAMRENHQSLVQDFTTVLGTIANEIDETQDGQLVIPKERYTQRHDETFPRWNGVWYAAERSAALNQELCFIAFPYIVFPNNNDQETD